jgi:hypothetical protein
MKFRFGTVVLACVLVATWAAGVGATSVAASAVTTRVAAGTTAAKVWQVDPGATYLVMREIGGNSPNRTDLSGDVAGADTGSMYSYQGKIYTAFGDSYGGAILPVGRSFWTTPREQKDHRSNTMAVSSDTNPADGLTYDNMITDKPGHAEELLSSLKNNVESTVIPTYGTAIGSRMYLHYMSIKTFGTNDQHWVCNGSGIAYSDDAGQTWNKGPLMWAGNSNFIQVSFVQAGAYVYVFGVGCLHGGVDLARVPSSSLLDLAAYRYWTGTNWSVKPSAAKMLVNNQGNQFSVVYNSYYKKWIMLSTAFMWTSNSLTGAWGGDAQPWSGAQQIVPDRLTKGNTYSPMLTPTFNNGPDIWFNLSNSLNYDVSLMHASLTPVGAPPAPQSVSAVAGIGEATVSWTAPTKANAAPITGYAVTAYYSNSTQYEENLSLPSQTFNSTATTQTISGLTTGTAYTFKVAAINRVGIGVQSHKSNAATPS